MPSPECREIDDRSRRALEILLGRRARRRIPFVISIRSVQALRLIAFDAYQRLSPQQYDPQLPVRVEHRRAMLAVVGQWPWPRTVLRDLALKLSSRARTIALDFTFPKRIAFRSRSRCGCRPSR
jgi:CHASE2 domain-containing sensor protein